MAGMTDEEKANAEQQKKVEAAEKAAAKAVAEKGDLMVATATIIQTGTDGKPETVLAGDAFYPAKVDIEFLTKAEAMREATETERVMRERLDAVQAAALDANTALG